MSNKSLFDRACEVIPGGVNSPVRAFGSVGGTPKFISRGEGVYLIDAEGQKYVDFICSWGPLIYGHASPEILQSITDSLHLGTSFGAPTENEILFAELLREVVPAIEKIRMVNSGTEATMSAVRLARGFTGRDLILKFNGCYHGHADLFLVEAGSGLATCGIAGSPGVPEGTAKNTISIAYNDLELVKQTLETTGAENFAAIILEPVAGNMGLIVPSEDYLRGLREICDEHGILLIFDEVMSGFRVALGGASERFGVVPDLVTLGKVIGGGLPVGAFGGREKVMNHLAPTGPVYQAGTLSGNPLAMSAGLATLKALVRDKPYDLLEARAAQLTDGFKQAALRASIPICTAYCGSMFGFFFSEKPVENFDDAKACDHAGFKKFFHRMLEKGVYLAPSSYEAGFLSTLHSEEIIDSTIEKAESVFAAW